MVYPINVRFVGRSIGLRIRIEYWNRKKGGRIISDREIEEAIAKGPQS